MEEFTEDDLRRTVKSVSIAVVQFWASWDRAYDERVKATLAELEPQYAGRVAFGRLNVE